MSNGYLSMMVLEKGARTGVVTNTPTDASVVKKTSTLPFPRPSLLARWMDHYGDVLGRLTLAETTLPGTHNWGTFAPQEGPPGPGPRTPVSGSS